MTEKQVLLKNQTSLSLTIDDRNYMMLLPDNCDAGELFDVCLTFANQVKILMEKKLEEVGKLKEEEDKKEEA